MENNKIDFVITWVDGNDPKWIEEKNKYTEEKKGEANSKIRYRDWGLLKYWFRGIEKNAPWVNKVYFITYGHLPQWLNTNYEKIKIIKHEDYIPKEYLPTFSSNVIELFINRIEGLSKNFVYFNDDMFLLDKFYPNDFFENNYPKDELILNAVSVREDNNIIEHIILNNLEILSKYFKKENVIKENKSKIYNLKYGKKAIKSILLKEWKYFTGIENPHVAIAYNKETWDILWEKEAQNFYKTAESKFRSKYDYNHWIFRYYQLLSGNFIPKSFKGYFYYDLMENNDKFLKNLKEHKYKMVCINDSNENISFEKVKDELQATFNSILNEKSKFEK